jgi:hypothetical protein
MTGRQRVGSCPDRLFTCGHWVVDTCWPLQCTRRTQRTRVVKCRLTNSSDATHTGRHSCMVTHSELEQQTQRPSLRRHHHRHRGCHRGCQRRRARAVVWAVDYPWQEVDDKALARTHTQLSHVVSRLPIQAVDAKKARTTAQQTHGQESEQAPRPALLKTEPGEAPLGQSWWVLCGCDGVNAVTILS